METALECYREFKANSRLSRQELEDKKIKKFRKFVQFLNTCSPYYIDLIKTHSIEPLTCIPTDFPILTKTQLMENYDRIVTDKEISLERIREFLAYSKDPTELFLDKYHILHSSGSTGKVGIFIFSTNDWIRGNASHYFSVAHNPEKSNPSKNRFQRLAFYGATEGHHASASMIANPISFFDSPKPEVVLFEVNQPMHKTIQKLNQFKPDLLVGYTQALRLLADGKLAETLIISPSQIVCVGETMTTRDKQLLERAFCCEAKNVYGCAEHLTMGHDYYNTNTRTLFDSDLIYEFLPESTLVTNLFNYTLPLIRYQMSDVIRPICKSQNSTPFLEVKNIMWRSENSPTFVNEAGLPDSIHPLSIVSFFAPGIDQFQMRVVSNVYFEFFVVISSEAPPADHQKILQETKKRLNQLLTEKGMANVTFKIITKESFSIDSQTQKFKLIEILH